MEMTVQHGQEQQQVQKVRVASPVIVLQTQQQQQQQEQQLSTKRVKVELTNLQDMLQQVREDFRAKDEAKRMMEHAIEKLRDELRELQDWTDKQQQISASAGAVKAETVRKLEGYRKKLVVLEEGTQRLRDAEAVALHRTHHDIIETHRCFESDLAVGRAALKRLFAQSKELAHTAADVDALVNNCVEQRQQLVAALAAHNLELQSSANALTRLGADIDNSDALARLTKEQGVYQNEARGVQETLVALREQVLTQKSSTDSALGTLEALNTFEMNQSELRHVTALDEEHIRTSAASDLLTRQTKQSAAKTVTEQLAAEAESALQSSAEQCARRDEVLAEIDRATAARTAAEETQQRLEHELVQIRGRLQEAQTAFSAAEQTRESVSKIKEEQARRLTAVQKEDVQLLREVLTGRQALERDLAAATARCQAVEEQQATALALIDSARLHVRGAEARREAARTLVAAALSEVAEEEAACAEVQRAVDASVALLSQRQTDELAALCVALQTAETAEAALSEQTSGSVSEAEQLQSALAILTREHDELMEASAAAETAEIALDETVLAPRLNELQTSLAASLGEELAAEQAKTDKALAEFKEHKERDLQTAETARKKLLALIAAAREINQAKAAATRKKPAVVEAARVRDSLHNTLASKQGPSVDSPQQKPRSDVKKMASPAGGPVGIKKPVASTATAAGTQKQSSGSAAKSDKPAKDKASGKAKETEDKVKGTDKDSGSVASGGDSWLFDGW